MIQTSYECDKCKDQEGYIGKKKVVMMVKGEDAEVEVDTWIDCDCKDRKRVSRLMKSSMITDEFSTLTFGNFETDNVDPQIQAAYAKSYAYAKYFKDFRHDRHNSICLLGNPGTGKTHLLTAIANNLLKRSVAVQYFPWIEGMTDLKNDFDALADKIERLKQVEVLFIDDLFKGRGNPTDFEMSKLFEIINYRYMNKLPILVSSERSIAEMCNIGDGEGEAVASRINQMCKNYKVTIVGDSAKINYRLL